MAAAPNAAAAAEIAAWLGAHGDSLIQVGSGPGLRLNIEGTTVTLAVPEGYPKARNEYIILEATGSNIEIKNLVSDTNDWIFSSDATGMTVAKLLEQHKVTCCAFVPTYSHSFAH